MSKGTGYDGTSKDLAKALTPFCTKADFFIYEEDPKKSKLNIKRLSAHGNMFKTLVTLHPTLVFQKTKLQEAFSIIFDKCNSTWPSPVHDKNKKG